MSEHELDGDVGATGLGPRMDLRYAYFGRFNTLDSSGDVDHFGVLGVAYRYPESDVMELALAFCDPTDSFCKSKAATLLRYRMQFGLRRHKLKGTHVPAKFRVPLLALDERAVITICRAFNSVVPEEFKPWAFRTWTLFPEMASRLSEDDVLSLRTGGPDDRVPAHTGEAKLAD